MKCAVFFGAVFLTSCAVAPVETKGVVFQFAGRDNLYQMNAWTFSGRAALTNEKESLSLSIIWSHQHEKDEIELAGPFGQGRTQIRLTETGVDFDYGDKKFHFIGDMDDQIAIHTGMAIPVSSLKYWVIGLVDPEESFEVIHNGFLQSNWRVRYEKMQLVGNDELPQKIKIEKLNVPEKKRAKLKLIIDHWGLE